MSAAELPDIERLLVDEHARADRTKRRIPALGAVRREFEVVGEERYRLRIAELAITLDLDRVRREHNELIGELAVSCGLPGAFTVDGDSLSIADFNLSSARARTDRAKLLASRSNASDFDWTGLIEEFAQRVLKAERTGQPAVDLRTLPRPNMADAVIEVDGLALPRGHSTIIFGDGGAAKSYTALHVAGKMAQGGIRVGYCDWELGAEEHRDRLERLFPDHMPRIMYMRCDRALIHEADRLRRMVRDHGIQYLIFDSVAFACDGPPESAEIAGRYFRAVRQIGIGSLHIAHVSKAEGADKRPFGSAFWHNGARSTWFAQVAEASRLDDVLQIGLFNRKANLGRLRAPTGFTVTFTEDLTVFRRSDVADAPDLASQLSIRQRMAHLLRNGSEDPARIAQEIDEKVDTVKRTARRYKDAFVVLEGGRIGLAVRRQK